MAQEPKYPVQTVMKALELLNHLAKNTGNLGAGVSELSDALGIGKSTVHRLLDTLQYYGYIEKSEETNRYRLGWELYKVGLSVPAQNQLFNIDRTHLLELGKKLNDRLWNNQRKRNNHYFQDGIYEQWHEQQCKPGRV